MEIDLSQFHPVFFEESFEGLDTMEQELLALEEDSDRENINTIFRAAHSIKGGSATFNFKEVADFTHVLETLLDEMREGQRAVSKPVVDLLLRAVDCLRNMLNQLQDGEPVGDAHVELVEYFNQLLTSQPGSEPEDQDALAEIVNSSLSGSVSPVGWHIRFEPEPHILQTGNEPLRMLRELKTFGQLESKANLQKVPDFDQLQPESCFISWDLKLDTEVEESAISEVFEWVSEDCQLAISPIAKADSEQQDLSRSDNGNNAESVSSDGAQGEGIVEGVNEQTATPPAKKSDLSGKHVVPVKQKPEGAQEKVSKPTGVASIRVGIDKVDTLIDLVGELVITQSMLSELGENFEVSKLKQLISGLSELEQNTRELQESVMRIRMLPISFVFNRLPRMVRDLSAQLGKQIDLKIKGESTELDKTVMEQIGDPLTHLVRNALDHGIEPVEQRLAAGKPEVGLVTLNAFHQGGNIVIEIVDDGGGIDTEVIYQKAVDKGLIEDGVELPEEQILSLIMEPGFSTAAVVSDVSGRGVGMDVVKRNINNLGGNVEIQSKRGSGTCFTIRLPLTLAILDGQLIRVAQEVFVLPLVSIIESVPLSAAEVSRVAGNMPVFKLANEYIPIVDLSAEFEIKPSVSSGADGLLAIVEGENRKLALRIDELLGQQQVVIKSLESHYKAIQGVSGATILGDGKVALILDIVGLAKRAAQNSGRQRERVA